MRFLTCIAVAVLMTACAAIQRPVTPETTKVTSSNLTDVSVSAPPGTSPEGIQQMLYKVAAITTIKNGYTKFQVVDEGSWKKAGLDKKLGAYKKEHFDGKFAPNATMNIRMYHEGDKGSESAISASQYAAGETSTLDALKKIQ